MGTREHKVKITQWFTIQIHYLSSDTHTQHHGNWGWWSDWNDRVLLAPCLHLFHLYPMWAGKWTVSLASSEQDSRQSYFNHSFVSLSWHIKLERQVAAGRLGWKMGGQRVRFSIMTHCYRITLEIKSKMLNFNQAPLMAPCEEWSLCLRWQAQRAEERERETGTRKPGETRWYRLLIHQIAC